MLESKEKRGRRGGKTRAGDFYHAAKCGVWYTAKSVQDFFSDKGIKLDYSEARSIFDSLRRHKCYPSIESKGEKGRKGRPIPRIKFTHKVLNSIELPPAFEAALGSLKCESISDNLMSRLTRHDFTAALSIKTLKLHASDTKLLEIAEAHANNDPICIGAGFYKVEAYEHKGDDVKIVLAKFSSLRAIFIGVKKALMTALKRIRREYKPKDKNLEEVIKIHQDGKPINFDGLPFEIDRYRIAGGVVQIDFIEARRFYGEHNVNYA